MTSATLVRSLMVFKNALEKPDGINHRALIVLIYEH
jgi:hypothetical protein